jgi:hypothetical protein
MVLSLMQGGEPDSADEGDDEAGDGGSGVLEKYSGVKVGTAYSVDRQAFLMSILHFSCCCAGISTTSHKWLQRCYLSCLLLPSQDQH